MSASPVQPQLDSRGLPAGYAFKPDYEITPRDLKQAMDAKPGSVLLIDVRRPDEWALARVEGFKLVPLDTIPAQVESLRDEVEASSPEMIAVLCHHGVRSLKAALFLRQQGLANAYSVAGGIELWSLAVDRSIVRY